MRGGLACWAACASPNKYPVRRHSLASWISASSTRVAASSAAWHLVAPALAAGGARVVALDFAGHGRSAHRSADASYLGLSYAEDTAAAIVALGEGSTTTPRAYAGIATVAPLRASPPARLASNARRASCRVVALLQGGGARASELAAPGAVNPSSWPQRRVLRRPPLSRPAW